MLEAAPAADEEGQTMAEYGLILAGVLAALMAVTWWLSRRFEVAISRPIMDLAQVAQRVQSQRDYSIRATKEGQDEIGELTDAFNQMLASVQEASQTLRSVNENLQAESERRAQVQEALRQLNETLEHVTSVAASTRDVVESSLRATRDDTLKSVESVKGQAVEEMSTYKNDVLQEVAAAMAAMPLALMIANLLVSFLRSRIDLKKISGRGAS